MDEIGVDVVTDRGVTGRMNGTIEREDYKKRKKLGDSATIDYTCVRSLDV